MLQLLIKMALFKKKKEYTSINTRSFLGKTCVCIELRMKHTDFQGQLLVVVQPFSPFLSWPLYTNQIDSSDAYQNLN